MQFYSNEKNTGKDNSSVVVEFVTEKHANSFNKLQKICILVTDKVASGSVKQSEFLRKPKMCNASSIFVKNA